MFGKAQGLATCLNPLRQISNLLFIRHRSRRNRHILVMSPEPQFLDPHSSNSSLQELVETQVHSIALHGAHYAIFELNYVLNGWGNYP